MRSTCTPIEPGADAGALERVLEEPVVVLRRANEDRHLVEWHTLLRLTQDPSGNLDTLASFARSREELERAIRRVRFGRLVRKQTCAKMIEVRTTGAGDTRNDTSASLQRLPRRQVIGGNSSEDVRGDGNQRAYERLLHRDVKRQIDEQQRRVQKAFASDRERCGGKQRGSIGSQCVGQFRFGPADQR
jgi:hypothetical protein